MAINFPNTPTLNQTISQGNVTWRWDGQAWTILPNNTPIFTTVGTTGNLSVGGNAAITGNALISGNATISGTLTATGTIVGLSLSDLSDIDLAGVGSNFLLSYNTDTQNWRTIAPSTGGVVTPGGSTGYVQFNTNGAFDGDIDLTYNKQSNTLTAVNIVASGLIQTTGSISTLNTTESTSPTTGAATISGGLGVGGDINVSGGVAAAGEVAISGNLTVSSAVTVEDDITTNGNVVVSTDPSATTHATNKGYVDRNITAFAIAFGA
jgi:cytoskeletal protein CcmA (bactofilin family)